MKNNITVYIALCGLLTTAGTTMAMEDNLEDVLQYSEELQLQIKQQDYDRNNPDQNNYRALMLSSQSGRVVNSPKSSPTNSPRKTSREKIVLAPVTLSRENTPRTYNTSPRNTTGETTPLTLLIFNTPDDNTIDTKQIVADENTPVMIPIGTDGCFMSLPAHQAIPIIEALKKSPHTSSIHSPNNSPRKNTGITETEQITRRSSGSTLETTQQQGSKQSLSRSQSQGLLVTNNMPQHTAPITIQPTNLNSSKGEYYSSSGSEHFSPDSSPILERTASKKEIAEALTLLQYDADSDSRSGEKHNITLTQTSTPESEARDVTTDFFTGFFTNTEPQGVIDCYQGIDIVYNWTNNTVIIFYTDSENKDQHVAVPVLTDNIPNEKYAYIKNTTSKTMFAIKLPQTKLSQSSTNATENLNSNTTNDANKIKGSMGLPSNNGKSPVYTAIGGLTFVAVCIALAYRYNKLPDSFIQLLNSILPTRYAL